jgi:hypothetical protein
VSRESTTLGGVAGSQIEVEDASVSFALSILLDEGAVDDTTGRRVL